MAISRSHNEYYGEHISASLTNDDYDEAGSPYRLTAQSPRVIAITATSTNPVPKVALPDARTMETGWVFTFVNDHASSAHDIYITDYAGTNLCSVKSPGATGTGAYMYSAIVCLVNNSTQNGTWAIYRMNEKDTTMTKATTSA